MQITRSSIETMKGPADWFTGDVYVDALATPAGSSTFAAALVHFTPGARTAWHTHPHGQTIFVTEGVGTSPTRSTARRQRAQPEAPRLPANPQAVVCAWSSASDEERSR
jgi:quercetin dioxygenase-like cupin family protein